MHNITLVFTSHSESGKCTSSEFSKIISKINPEVIFEELSSFGFNLFYNENKSNSLETKAIKMYLQNSEARHIPVDNYDIRKCQKIKKDIDYLFDLFESNIDYRKLKSESIMMKTQGGFKYLNSEQCSEMFERINDMEQSILRNINNEKYTLDYKSWLIILDERENEMIRNIYNYCEVHKFNKGLFYIGAWHRKSIIRKIYKSSEVEKLKINWNYNKCCDIL